MRLKMMVAVAAVSATALLGGSVAAFATGPDGEHGHGFNCTPGNPGNAEFQHTSRDKEDHGNGEDCPQSTPVAPTTTVVPVQPSSPVSPSAPAQQATVSAGAVSAVAVPAAASARPPTAAVVAQPRTTG